MKTVAAVFGFLLAAAVPALADNCDVCGQMNGVYKNTTDHPVKIDFHDVHDTLGANSEVTKSDGVPNNMMTMNERVYVMRMRAATSASVDDYLCQGVVWVKVRSSMFFECRVEQVSSGHGATCTWDVRATGDSTVCRATLTVD